MNDVERALAKCEGKRAWFYLRDEETKEHFKAELISLKAIWRDGSLVEPKHNVSSFMAVHSDHKVAFISNMCWQIGSTAQYQESIMRIDYQKLIRHEDYLLK